MNARRTMLSIRITSPARAGRPAGSRDRARPLQLFASLWSLRQYPTAAREWSWPRKFAAIADAGFDGVCSPPMPALAGRGDLAYLAITSLGVGNSLGVVAAALELGAVGLTVQLGRPDTPLGAAVTLTRKIQAAAGRAGLPFAVETHRGTFTETPEATARLLRAHHRRTGRMLPLCLDPSHFAVVRHLDAVDLWAQLSSSAALLDAATQFHLRPFNAHHCQLPALTPAGRRTPEYRLWLHFAARLLAHERARRTPAPLVVVVEIGHLAPAYRLSGFPDTWRDVQTVAADLRRLWRQVSAAAGD